MYNSVDRALDQRSPLDNIVRQGRLSIASVASANILDGMPLPDAPANKQTEFSPNHSNNSRQKILSRPLPALPAFKEDFDFASTKSSDNPSVKTVHSDRGQVVDRAPSPPESVKRLQNAPDTVDVPPRSSSKTSTPQPAFYVPTQPTQDRRPPAVFNPNDIRDHVRMGVYQLEAGSATWAVYHLRHAAQAGHLGGRLLADLVASVGWGCPQGDRTPDLSYYRQVDLRELRALSQAPCPRISNALRKLASQHPRYRDYLQHVASVLSPSRRNPSVDSTHSNTSVVSSQSANQPSRPVNELRPKTPEKPKLKPKPLNLGVTCASPTIHVPHSPRGYASMQERPSSYIYKN